MIHYLSSSIINDRSIETKKRSLRKIAVGVKKSDPVQFEIFAGAQPTTHPPGLAALGAVIVALIEPRERGFADCTTSALLATTVSYTQRAPTTQGAECAA